ncbi:dTDP-4-dehydrorhamnose reductase [Planctomycetales bacterium 10988]|nr:dTDP-4-dehydrorhamnose reductase [Planctomycetales bacterium 10988]
MRLPLLVTGIAGVAGFNAYHYFAEKYPGQVVGIRQKDNWRLQHPGIVACDAEDKPGLRRLFEKYRFQSVLNAAGNCALRACELDPALAWRTNVAGLDNLLDFVAGTDIRLLHLSIDLVFSGAKLGGYLESDDPDPVTVYGKTMAAAEERLARRKPDACTLRISLPMGISFNGHAGAIDWIQSRYRQEKPATLYYDEVRTPTYVACMNRMFEELFVKEEITGLYHAGGPIRLSLYQIAQIVNKVGGYDPRLVQGCYRIEAGPMPPRAGNVTMDSSRLAEALGRTPFDPWPLDPQYLPTDREWHLDDSIDLGGSADLLTTTLYQNPRLPDPVPPSAYPLERVS